ncbi:hypothetical protein ACIG3E_32685 [Streptomyces sp. NPDC053474]|uniref:hypothetical protein n=1 Tax=Streptomyces sp. NPDC053474 TaxID=3365704 RepID=UPI0037CED1A3
MSGIRLRHGSREVTVSTLAFTLDGTPQGLASVRTGHLVHLVEDALGLASGHYQVGHYQGRPERGERSLHAVSAVDAATIRDEGAAVYRAAPDPSWRHPFATPVNGLRLGEVRAFLSQHADLPDDALVVIGPADHHAEGDSPALRGITVGAYVPAMSARGNYGDFWSAELSDTPRPERSIPAVHVSPSV